MNNTELSRIRAIAEADKAGADREVWDGAITPDVVIGLCDKVELCIEIAHKIASSAMDIKRAGLGGEIPVPLPGHVGDCDKALVKITSERDELKSQIKKLGKEKAWLCDMCEYFCNAMPEGNQCRECPALRYCKQHDGVDWSTASSKAVMSAYEQICSWSRGNV